MAARREGRLAGSARCPGAPDRAVPIPLTVLGRLYPADHPVGRSRVADGDDRRRPVGPRTSTGRSTSRRSAPELAASGPWAMPWISDRLRQPGRLPVGPRTDPRVAPQAPPRGGLRGLRRARATAPRRTSPTSSAISSCRSSSTPSSQPRPGCSTWPTSRRRIATKIVRRHPHVFGDAEARTAADVDAPVGDDQGSRACGRRERADAERADAAERSAGPTRRRRCGRADGTAALSRGSAGRCPPLPPARRCRSGLPPSATTGRRSTGSWTRSTRSWPSCSPPRPRRERVEEIGDLLLVLVNLARRHGVEAEAALRSANDKFRRRFGSVERAAAARGVALRDLDFAQLDELWDAAKVEERAARAATASTEGLPAMTIGNRAHGPRRRPSSRRAPPGHPDPRRPEVGRGLVPDPRRRHRGAVRRDHRGPGPAASSRQGDRLGDRRVFDAPAGHRRAQPTRVGQGPDRRPHPRDPAARRPLAARRRRPGQARRTDGHRRLRRAPGRRRHPDGVDHRRLRRPRRGAHHVRHGTDAWSTAIAAVSVGIVDGVPLLDLDYPEDSRADVDFNVVGTDAGTYVEVQGTAEGQPFDRAAMNGLLDLAQLGLDQLFEAQAAAVATVKR